MSITTRAAVLKGPYDIELTERELVCGPTEVIVKNHLMGICGSDKNFYRGQLPPQTAEFRQAPGFPFYLGHESGGTVVEVGEHVHEYKVGDQVMAFGWNNNFADYFKAPVTDLQPAPPGLDLDLASLGEPIGCAMFAGMEAQVKLGDVVAVFGAGFAGQVIAQCAKAAGAYQVAVVDVCAGKLRLAKELGADVTINAKEQDPVAALKDLTGGHGVDVVVEAAGSESSLNQATQALAHGGKFVFYSWVTQPVRLDISRWHDDGFTFINACLVHHSREERFVWAPRALRPVAQGLVKIRPLITHEFQLGEIKDAFAQVDKDDTVVKVVLRP
ncbi:MAG TPA: zinc-binding dehydrogenase [Firmicutes bacterium]|nr:zinc-binding dehydrogenase [Bacillota bacterium]